MATGGWIPIFDENVLAFDDIYPYLNFGIDDIGRSTTTLV